MLFLFKVYNDDDYDNDNEDLPASVKALYT